MIFVVVFFLYPVHLRMEKSQLLKCNGCNKNNNNNNNDDDDDDNNDNNNY
jgi:hypothetical protein